MTEEESIWIDRAARLLDAAAGKLRSGEEAWMEISAAEAALKIDAGELPAEELEGYPFPGEASVLPECTCPPDLRARGGWSSTCPFPHSLATEEDNR